MLRDHSRYEVCQRAYINHAKEGHDRLTALGADRVLAIVKSGQEQGVKVGEVEV